MKSKKQSSIEWLIEQIIKEKGLVDLDIQQAKQLHKQEIMDAYRFPNTLLNISSEQYYRDTFETDNSGI